MSWSKNTADLSNPLDHSFHFTDENTEHQRENVRARSPTSDL